MASREKIATPPEVIRGFSNLDTSNSPKHLGLDQLSMCINFEWLRDKLLYTRRGSTSRKTSAQWGSDIFVIDSCTFKTRDDDFYYELSFLSDGRVFYITSDDINYGSTTATYTEILNSDGVSSPALAITRKVSFGAINNVLYIVDGSSNIWSWNGDNDYLTLVADPSNVTITMTVLDTADAIVGDIYSDNANATRKFYVKTTKVSGDGVLSISLRQTAGNTRTASSGTLNRDSGTGDATIAFTAVSYSDTYEEYKLYQRRGFVVANEGNIHVSISRNGSNFTGAGSGVLEFDVIEGLKVSNFIAFKRGAIVTTEDRLTRKFSLHTLTGFKFFDAMVPNTDTGQFKAVRESNVHGIVGRSGQEIGNVAIGLTPNGFIAFGGEISDEFGIIDQLTLSSPIKNKIEQINFEAADEIFSVVDTNNQRYICAVPTLGSNTANALYVYDYGRSTAEYPRWSIWYLGFGSVGGLFNIKGSVCISDRAGNIYNFLVDGVYDDAGLVYNKRLETAAFASGTSFSSRYFSKVYLDFRLPTDEQEVTVYSRLDGHLIRTTPTGYKIKNCILKPAKTSPQLVSDIVYVDDLTVIGSNTVSDYQFPHASVGGKGNTEQIGIFSNEAGVNFGITGLVIESEGRGASKR